MKLPKLDMKAGVEPGKLAILGILVLVGAYLFYTNVLSAPSGPAATPAPRPAAAPPVVAKQAPVAQPLAPRSNAVVRDRLNPNQAAPRDFRPSLKASTESASADPTLRLDLITKLAGVQVERVERSLFDFSSIEAPRPKLPEPKIQIAKVKKRMIGPEPPPPPAPPPVKPPPPPITLKFYGNAMPVAGGPKRVFCIQGDDIHVPSEGDVLMRRYRIVRINANSVLVEDLDYKHQQSVPIDQPPNS
jgi:hypothetical protein